MGIITEATHPGSYVGGAAIETLGQGANLLVKMAVASSVSYHFWILELHDPRPPLSAPQHSRSASHRILHSGGRRPGIGGMEPVVDDAGNGAQLSLPFVI